MEIQKNQVSWAFVLFLSYTAFLLLLFIFHQSLLSICVDLNYIQVPTFPRIKNCNLMHNIMTKLVNIS